MAIPPREEERLDAFTALQLEQFRIGELDDQTAKAIEAELADEGHDGRLARRLAELDADDVDVRARHPVEVIAPAIRARLVATPAPSPNGWRPRFGWLPIAAAAAAAVVLVVRPGVEAPPEPSGIATAIESGVRAKGNTRLVINRKTVDGPEALDSFDAASAGDVLQLGYVAARRRHGVIVSLDGRGAVTLHFPDGPDADTSLPTTGHFTLPHAYELDDAPEFERFVLVQGDAPLSAAAVLEAARHLAGDSNRAASDPLPIDGVDPRDQISFVVKKTP